MREGCVSPPHKPVCFSVVEKEAHAALTECAGYAWKIIRRVRRCAQVEWKKTKERRRSASWFIEIEQEGVELMHTAEAQYKGVVKGKA